MHIVIANQWYPPESGWGGVALYNYAVANAYRALGHAVTIIARQTGPDAVEVTTNGITIRRLQVVDHYRLRKTPLIGRYVRSFQQFTYSWRVRQSLAALHRQHPIDVIECAEINAEGFWAARTLDLPLIVRCHTPNFVLKNYFEPDEMPYHTGLTEAWEKDCIRRAAALTAPSHDLARIIARECQVALDRITVIPNALPPEMFERSTFQRLNTSDSVTVLYVGRLERVKGIQVLARAIPQVVRQVPNARFRLVGYDRPTPQGKSMRAELEKQFQQTGAQTAVEFLGAVEQLQLPALYQATDLCVVPSLLYESFSYTCAQAMAAGKAVVASRIGGIPETIDDNLTGLLVEPGQVADLAAAIIRLVQDRSLRERMGRAGYEKAKAHFDPIKVAQQNLIVYEHARQQFSQHAPPA